MGRKKRTFEEVRDEALKYETRKAFELGSKWAYVWATKNKKLNDVCGHMVRQIHKPYTKEEVLAEALNHTTRVSFMRNSKGVYNNALTNGLLEEACAHMDNGLITYSEEHILARAKRYTSRKEFEEEDPRGYDLVRHRGLKKQAFAHMGSPRGGFDPCKSATLYYLSINNGQAYKIGITNKTVAQRYSGTSTKNKASITVLKEWSYPIGEDAYSAEQEILKEFSYAKYTGISLLSDGNSELFNSDILGLDI